MQKWMVIVFVVYVAGGAVPAEPVVGGFAPGGSGERIEQVVGDALPVWQGDTGVYVELGGQFAAAGDASIVLRMADEKHPLMLVWNSAGHWRLVSPGAVPRDFPAQAMPGTGVVTETWRLQIHGLHKPFQRVQLTVLNAGAWQVAMEKEMALPGLREWIEGGGIVTAGIAGTAGMADTNVRVIRNGTLFLVR